MNARERVRQALLCRKPDNIPKALGFFNQSLAAIAPTRPENYFDLVDIGVNAINPVQPDCMDAAAIKRAFGDKLAMWGTVGTSRLWDWGNTGPGPGRGATPDSGTWARRPAAGAGIRHRLCPI